MAERQHVPAIPRLARAGQFLPSLGHDIQLKRHANLPLVGRPLPWQLEHGLKVTPEAQFEQPKHWSRGALCMGPRRAQWMEEQHQRPGIAIGPWIAYSQSLLSTQHLDQWRQKLGPTLLVVLALSLIHI